MLDPPRRRPEARLRGCFFFNDTATTEIYTLSLHDALPIYHPAPTTLSLPITKDTLRQRATPASMTGIRVGALVWVSDSARSEEHTSELQSRLHLVCRLLLEKKKELTKDKGCRYQGVMTHVS